VICLDNSIHIVPALSLCDKSRSKDEGNFSNDCISSFLVITPPTPSSGEENSSHSDVKQLSRGFHKGNNYSSSYNKVNELISSNYSKLQQPKTISESTSFNNESIATSPCDVQSILEANVNKTEAEVTSTCMESSGISTSSIFPHPTVVVWWKTHLQEDRLIIGYSNGSILVGGTCSSNVQSKIVSNLFVSF